MKKMTTVLKMAAKLFSRIPAPIAILSVLVIVVLVFANPFFTVRDLCSNLFRNTVTESGSSLIKDIKAMGLFKPTKRYVGGFLELPSNIPRHAKLRNRFNVTYQWEGSAEFSVDFEKIQVEKVSTNSIVLHMPKIEIDNYRVNSFTNEGERLVIRNGDKHETDRILNSIDPIVRKTMERMLDTEDNREAARLQTEQLLQAIIHVASNMDVEFDWGERAVEKK